MNLLIIDRAYPCPTGLSYSRYTAWLLRIFIPGMHAFHARCFIAMYAILLSVTATASDLTVGPDDYLSALRTMEPGHTLRFRAGVYTKGLPIRYINGTQKAPIVITGPATGSPAVFLARRNHNTVSIVNSSYVTVQHLTLNGQGLPVDAIKAEGYSDWAHHITLEDLVINGHGANQQTVGISTKCPAWGWIIRRNVIAGAGTGVYLGDSDGTDPFFAGLIEHNLIVDSIGYNLQIKHQYGRLLQEMPVTTIRHNVFSKLHNASPPPDARPNVLVGHWPGNGPGASDHYEIYGNLFYQNPYEALFQGEGNLGLYNNIFINDYGDAIHIQPHNDIPKAIDIFSNTILARDKGIVIQSPGEDIAFQQNVIANAVFANIPITGGIRTHNTAAALSDAPEYLMQPFGIPGDLDLSPRQGRLRGEPPLVSGIDRYRNWNRDFDGHSRGTSIKGAYGTSNSTERWRPGLELKPAIKSSGTPD